MGVQKNSAYKDRVLVLFSGGLDSSACIQYYLNLGCEVVALFIKYGQSSEKKEYESAILLCEYFKVELITSEVNTERSFTKGELLGRNLMLISIALLVSDNYSKIIIGIHNGTPYYDCSFQFFNKAESIVKEYTTGLVLLEAPFLNLNKMELFHYIKSQNIPFELSYSCEIGEDTPCGVCLSCIDNKKLYGEVI